MRREVTDLIGSGLLLAALLSATFAVLASTPGAGTAVSVGSDELYERGRALFYAKGCVSCHRKAGELGTMEVGPDLTNLAERAGTRRPGMSAEAYVRESIKSPSAYVASVFSSAAMPELGLADHEIDALVRFLLASRYTSTLVACIATHSL